MTVADNFTPLAPFNGPVEIGLRALALLNEAFPACYSLQRLVVFDYLVVHSDDMPGGPTGLHPKTPHRGGEMLVRRVVLEQGLLLYQSRSLVERRYTDSGLMYAATERSASFLDALSSEYLSVLRERAAWLVLAFGEMSDTQLVQIATKRIGEWGAEFAMESVLKLKEETWQ
ncbi:MAG: ABC-three component system middle component 2 [Rhodoferax sp.]|uniref:ABC-three component system middle component 2 n=1 Tax=Rhodoferax sp. TaxID=50421 RepID=UPI003C70A160